MDSSVEQCELCHGLRGHKAIKDAMFKEFNKEYQLAREELKRLHALYREACWYNFETQCRKWRHPWHATWDASAVEMHGHRHVQSWVGCRELTRCEFPVWYSGAVGSAPPLPPEMILIEIRLAEKHVLSAKEQRWAPYDYAPGGTEYEKLLRGSPGVLAYDLLHRNARQQSSN
jgi:hypothetical protein